jgi:Fe-S-cluster containining protein
MKKREKGSSMKTKRPKREEIPAGEVPCHYCPGKCCRYFALPIDTPESRREYGFIRWFLLHERATVFVDEKTWYLLVYSKCNHLDETTNRCGIYETRPQICRDYSSNKCEYEDHYVYEQYFELPEQVEEYAEAVLGSHRKQGFRSLP